VTERTAVAAAAAAFLRRWLLLRLACLMLLWQLPLVLPGDPTVLLLPLATIDTALCCHR
jgi:hypothetical protein